VGGDAFHVVDIVAVGGLKQGLAENGGARFQFLGANPANAHLYALAVAEAALQQNEAAVGKAGHICNIEAADILDGKWAGRRTAEQPGAQIAGLVGEPLGKGGDGALEIAGANEREGFHAAIGVEALGFCGQSELAIGRSEI